MINVIDKYSLKKLTTDEILLEVNRDRSNEWTAYTAQDLADTPHEVLDWIDLDYYDVSLPI